MSQDLATLPLSLERALVGEAIRMVRKSATHWTGFVLNGATHPLEVCWDQGWLLFSEGSARNFRPARGKDIWNALRRNTAAQGVGTVLTAHKQLLLCSELLLPDESDLGLRVRAVIESFLAAWDRLPPTATAVADEWPGEMEARCAEAGWSCTRRATGRLTAALETTPVFQATITPLGEGARFEVEAADLGTYSTASRMAAAVLALETSRHIRLVRATTDEAQSRIGFSVSLPGPIRSEELAAGFAGLSAAMTATNEILAALQNENLAGDYLAIRGWPAKKQNQKKERTHT